MNISVIPDTPGYENRHLRYTHDVIFNGYKVLSCLAANEDLGLIWVGGVLYDELEQDYLPLVCTGKVEIVKREEDEETVRFHDDAGLDEEMQYWAEEAEKQLEELYKANDI